MPVDLTLPGHPPHPCESYRHHVHAAVTHERGREDPRVLGRSRHEAISVTRRVDGLSPHLLHCCAAGVRLDTVTLRLVAPVDPDDEDAGDAALPRKIFAIELSDVLVISVVNSVEDDGPLETVQFDYGTVSWTYTDEHVEVVTGPWPVHR